MARSRTKLTTVEGGGTGLMLTQQPEAVVSVGGLAGVIAKTLALCGRTPGLTWGFAERHATYDGEWCREFTFRISLGSGLEWTLSLCLPADECDAPEFEARLATMAEKVYAGATAELANTGG